MTPDQKRAAGKGVVGYLRVSAAGQTDGWSLDSQERAVRDWAAQHGLPIIAIEQTPEGHESGATAFDDRIGWQAVEQHIAGGRVGWIAVAAIDRLSRDLGALADRVRVWTEQDIAIVAPSQGYSQLEGVGPFLMHIWGTLADHERKRLLGRVLPGMQARLRAGLPLGRQPLGYLVATDVPVEGQRARRHLMPDSATAPIIQALYQQALFHPDWGDRRMAAWATGKWSHLTWSTGRIAGILTNEIYAGVLRGAVQAQTVILLDNHPAIVPAGDFSRVQTIRRQRAGDLMAGFNAVHASSWLGGIVRCWLCGGIVNWRTGSTGDSDPPHTGGRYVCSGGPPVSPEATVSHGCGAAWPADIETFVWRGVECILEREAGALRAMAAQAVDLLPGMLDHRRQQAQAELDAATAEENSLTDDLVADRIGTDAYVAAEGRRNERRQAAMALMQETDGWTYLARLIVVREGPEGGCWRWIPLQAAIWHLDMPERRRLLRSISARITLDDPDRIGRLDGPGEDAAAGRFQGVSFALPRASGAISAVAVSMATLLSHRPGWDMDRQLQVTGWERITTETGVVWRHRATGRTLAVQPAV